MLNIFGEKKRSVNVHFKRTEKIDVFEGDIIPRELEVVVYSVTGQFKIGDGVTPLKQLPISTTLPSTIKLYPTKCGSKRRIKKVEEQK